MELRSHARRLPHVERQQLLPRRGGKATPRRIHQRDPPRPRARYRAPGPARPPRPSRPLVRSSLGRLASARRSRIVAIQPGNGLYRIRGRSDQLVYIGEGNVRDRLRTHAAKLRHTSPQGAALAAAAPLEYSAVLNPDWLPHERLELETDLIAAHTIAFAAPPAAQFIG